MDSGYPSTTSSNVDEQDEAKPADVLSEAGSDDTLMPEIADEPDEEEMEIVIRDLSGRPTTMVVSPKTTVHDLKVKYQKPSGIQPAEQRLIHQGKQLADNKMVKDYNIKSGDSLQSTMRLHSG